MQSALSLIEDKKQVRRKNCLVVFMSLESVNTSLLEVWLVNARISRLKFGNFEPENLKYKTASDEQQVFSTICIIIIKNDPVKSSFFDFYYIQFVRYSLIVALK